jgi:pyruvate,water dikinase
LAAFIRKFGHLSDSGNDFSAVPWREDPDRIIRMILEQSPDVPRAASSGPRLGAVRGPLWRWIFRRARRYRLLREKVSSLYTFGYGMFRDLSLELGARLTRRGLIDRWEDILYLYLPEVHDEATTRARRV